MNVYEARHAGREYCCNTEGSDHYKEGGVEPLDLMIAKGMIEDFCIGNMSKYAFRFKKTRNLEDLKKVSDYAHILCGVELNKSDMGNPTTDKPVEPWGEEDDERQDRILCNLPKRPNCGDCIFYKNAKLEGLSGCTTWCKFHPAEARKLMDEWEDEHGLD